MAVTGFDRGGANPKGEIGKLLFWPVFPKTCIKTRSPSDPPMIRKYCHGADYMESTDHLESVTNDTSKFYKCEK